MEQSPPIFTQADFAKTNEGGGAVETIAFVLFFGVIAFCAVQACLAPRRTFCAQKQAD